MDKANFGQRGSHKRHGESEPDCRTDFEILVGAISNMGNRRAGKQINSLPLIAKAVGDILRHMTVNRARAQWNFSGPSRQRPSYEFAQSKLITIPLSRIDIPDISNQAILPVQGYMLLTSCARK